MKRFLLFLVVLVLLMVFWFCLAGKKNPKPVVPVVSDATLVLTNLSAVKSTPSLTPTNPAGNTATDKLASQAPDVLSATNLEQWKALIKDLKQDQLVRRHWSTPRFRSESPPVLLKHNGQSILYKADAIDVSTLPKTQDFMEAEIYSPKMNLDETRALALKLCDMFGFNSSKFQAWADQINGNWLDAPMFNETDPGHLNFLKVRKSYNNDQPWYIIFSTSSESAVAKLMGKP